MLKSNTFYKIASVVVAVALSVYVNGERNPYETKTLTLMLNVLNQEPATLIRSIPSSVQVEVSAPRQTMLQLTPRDFEALVNLDGKLPGSHEVKVLVRPAPDAVIPPDVTYTASKPTVQVVIEAVAKRLATLQPVFLRPAPSGYSYGTPQVQPGSATITGPRSSVGRVAALQVVVDAQPPPDKALTGIFPIQAVDRSGRIIADVTIFPAQARVTTGVQPMPAEKEILVSADISGVPAAGYKIASIQVVPQSVIVTGNPAILTKLNFVNTQELNINQATASVVRSLLMELPEGITAQGSRRVRVEVVILPRGG